MTQSEPNYYNLRSGLTLYPSQQQEIEQIISDTTQQIPANFTLLADVTGQVVSTRGGQHKERLVALGSLIAGDLAASHEIARLTGQFQEYQMILREGQTTHTFICQAGEHLALLVQASTEIPLGWGRMVIQKMARQIATITETTPPEAANPHPEATHLPIHEENLPDLFNDALDDLWME